VALVLATVLPALTAGAQTGLPASTLEFPPGAAAVELPFRIHQRWMVVTLTLNGDRALEFIFDTGAPVTVVTDEGLVAALGLTPATHVQVAGADGATPRPAPLVAGLTLEGGGARLSNVPIVFGVAGAATPGVDGIIGRAILAHAVVEVDWQARVLRLHPPDRFEYAGRGTTLPLTVLSSGHASVPASVTEAGGATRAVQLVLDTGAGHALSLELDDAARARLRDSLVTDTVVGWGANGPLRGDIGRVRALNLGGQVLGDVVTTFPRSGPWTRIGARGGGRVDGNLGMRVLERFRVFIDEPGGRLILEPNDRFGEVFTANTTGLVLRPWPPGAEAAEIADVWAGSPAAELGIRSGYRLVAINGRPIGEIPLGEVVDLLESPPGTTLAIHVWSGEKRYIDRTLVTARLF